MTPEEIKAKVRELITGEQIVFVLGTVDGDNAPQMRWMGALVLEGNFEILMATSASARKVRQMGQNPKAQLLFSSEDYKQVATLSGTAEMVESLDRKKKFWDQVPACADYHESPDDSDFGLISFKTQVIEYLDLSQGIEPMRVEV
ncbi:MAG: pyridoxamine 5'-phosphate oxidase family protein [Planctomycetes bacterium]|nr:pyridoxamine 5'-phosphate oxidase family protein [Planctomycetota bacterium]